MYRYLVPQKSRFFSFFLFDLSEVLNTTGNHLSHRSVSVVGDILTSIGKILF